MVDSGHAQSRASKAASLAQHFLEARTPSSPTTSSPSLVAQTEHRIHLVSYWDIKPGSRVLEIGCGQGDCTIVLADAVGETGHVDAVDPGAADYGSPFTLSQAQSFIAKGPLGSRISFHLSTNPLTYLSSYTGPSYNYVVLCHCIWYFSSPSILGSTISSLPPRLTPHSQLCIAEWSLRSMKPPSQPHVLTALLLCLIESKRTVPASGNIRVVLSPMQIVDTVHASAGFKLLVAEVRDSNEGLLDGFWEVGDLLRKRGRVLGEFKGEGEKELSALVGMYDAVQANVDGLEGGVSGVRSMDVWVGKFEAI